MIGNDWDKVLDSVWKSEGFNKFMNNVKAEYQKNTCYPEFNNIFNDKIIFDIILIVVNII